MKDCRPAEYWVREDNRLDKIREATFNLLLLYVTLWRNKVCVGGRHPVPPVAH